jgi:hypothetical protein
MNVLTVLRKFVALAGASTGPATGGWSGAADQIRDAPERFGSHGAGVNELTAAACQRQQESIT